MSIKQIIEKYENDTMENILRRLYVEEDKSIREVASELNVSPGIIHKWLVEEKVQKIKKLV